MFNRRKFIQLMPAGLAGSIALPSALASSYPARAVRVIVPFSPGGGADVIARLILQPAAEALGRPCIVDNRPGASGIIGTDAAAKSPPDGYTLLLGQTGPNAINPSLYAKLPYDAVNDFTPIIQTTAYPYVVVVPSTLGVQDLKGLIALAKAKPGELTYGSAGNGSSTQLAAEMLLGGAGIKMLHVPYKGTAPALVDVTSGQLTLMCADVTSVASLVQSGKLTAIAVTGAGRSPLFPDLPTVAESGLPGFEASAWHGFFAPAGTPEAIIAKWHSVVQEALNTPELRNRFARDGIEVVGSTPTQFSAYVKDEIRKWAQVVTETGIKL